MILKANQDVQKFYDQIAEAYARELFHELEGKPFDQIILRAFASRSEGSFVDFSCGPGQTTRFLKDCGVNDIVGVDISAGMIFNARKLNPDIRFEHGNLLALSYPSEHFNHALCFYGIVHFDTSELRIALSEVYRVLKHDGHFLFSFHVGVEAKHYDELFGHSVDIDFQFFEKMEVVDLCIEAGFKVIDVLERNPYVGLEHPSQRAYIQVKK
ncbi:MAG: class I SAM-dependent methyltransferase [Cyclobacteriaceae bacterium]